LRSPPIVPTFPEYGLQIPEKVRIRRRVLTPLQLMELNEIEYQLTLDPEKHRDRLVPLGDGDDTFMYERPDSYAQVTFQLDRRRKILRVLNEAAPLFRPQKFIFISYSHDDELLFREFKTYLASLAQRGLVQWSDEDIEKGVKWKAAILKALASCRAALLLVSQTFITSRFIRTEELPRLLKRADTEGMKLYWLPLKPSMVEEETTITAYQALIDIKRSLAEIRQNKPKYERTLRDITKLLYNEVKMWANPARRAL